MKKTILFIPAFILFTQGISFSIVPNQSDNFQDGTTQNWISGALNPNPPQIIQSGGPAGTGDKFLRVTSSGTGTSGSKLVFFNKTQWSGNYISTGVVNISMWVNNTGLNLLRLRIALSNGSAWVVSSNPIIVAPALGWQVIVFSLLAADLTPIASSDYTSVLSAVTELRILHSTLTNYMGEQIVGQLDLDVITAAASPVNVKPQPILSVNNYSLSQNYPNPYNPSTSIKYNIPFSSFVSLSVYNLSGDKIKTLLNEFKPVGTYEIIFNASGIASGIYFYTLKAISTDNKYSYTCTRKMILVK